MFITVVMKACEVTLRNDVSFFLFQNKSILMQLCSIANQKQQILVLTNLAFYTQLY
jgi:hypothetical protein